MSEIIRRIALTILATAVITVGMSPFLSSHAAEDKFINVMFIGSYSQGDKWTDRVVEGIRSVLDAKENVVLHIEHLDARRHTDKKHFELFGSYLNNKYKNHSLAAVIVSDDAAFNLALEMQDGFLRDIPIVFCGVNNFSAARIAGRKNITGVNEAIDIPGTLQLALKLFPRTENIAVILSDISVIGKINLDIYGKEKEKLQHNLKIQEIFNLTRSDAPKTLASLPANTVILRLANLIETDRSEVSLQESIRVLSMFADVPVFTFWDFDIGSGGIGGMVTYGFQQGKSAAELFLRIMNGESPDRLPVVMKSPNIPMFDYKILEHFRVRDIPLPENSVVVNKSFSLFERYKTVIIASTVLVITMAVGIALLLYLLTMKRRAEKALQKSEERLLLALDAADEGFYDWHFDSGKVYFSPRYYTLLGYSPGDFEPSFASWARLAHPEDYPLVNQVIDSVKHGLDNYDIEYRIKAKNGTWVWVRSKGKVVAKNEFNAPLRLVGTHTDVTDRKMAEIAIKAGEKKMADILDSVHAYIFIKDTGYRYTYANRKVCELFSTSADNIVGRKDDDFFSSGSLEEIRRSDSRVIEMGETVAREEESLVGPDGTPRTYWTVKIPLRNNDNRIYGLCGISTDITKLKQAERELKATKNYLRNTINSMPSIIIGIDISGTVTQWNAEAVRITGLDAEKAVGQDLSAAFPTIAPVMPVIIESLKSGKPLKLDKNHFLEKGEVKYYEITAYPLGQTADEGAVVRIDDVTRRIKLEEIMIQTEKMMSVGGLAAGMAHEINNPLGIILQSAQNIARRLSPDTARNHELASEYGIDFNQVLDYIEKRNLRLFIDGIREAGERAARIVANMLEFSRPGDERHALCDIARIIDKAIELAASDYDLRKRYDFRHISVVRNYSECPQVLCSASEIEQVVLNLLRNAAQSLAEKDFSLSGGRPEINARIACEGEMVRVEIEDNGLGMSEEIRRRVFEPFFTTKPVGSGTGLGLSVSFFIITANHGGTFSAESEEGKGSRFIFRLPLEKRKME